MKKQLFIFFAAICSLSAFTQTIPAYVPTNGLVGWYPFTGNANDESGNGNNGVPMNGVTLCPDRTNNLNNAYSFDGNDDYIQTPINSNYNSYSFSAWIKPNIISQMYLFGNDDEASSGKSMYLTNNGGLSIYNCHPIPSSNCYVIQSVVTASNTIVSNSWTHVLASVNNGTVTYYVNGIDVGQGNGVEIFGINWSIGAKGNLYTQLPFNGKLDDIGVWNRALTACEIEKLYTANAAELSISASSTTICSGQSINLTASGATNYLWNTAATSSSITINPNTNTIYSVTSTYGTGCIETKTISIIVNQTPTVAVNSTTICSGTNATIISSGASSYSWDNGATTNSISVSPIANTIYTVTGLTDGCSDTKTVSVTVNQTPTIAVNSSTICSGTNANIIASGATSYSWDSGATTNSISVSPNSNTNYTVTGLTNGCSDTKTVSVTVNQTPTVAVNSATICSGTNASIVASGATIYSWDNGATTNSISVSPIVNTNYTVTGLTNGCSDTKTVSVTVNQTPTVAVNSATICSGNSFTINPNGAATYSYSNGSAIVSPITTSTYTVTGSSIENCVSVPQTLTVTVEANATITSQPTNQTLLAGTSAIFTITASGNSIIQWQTNLGVGFQNLTNVSQYSGVNTATLTVSNLNISNDNQTFRCIVGTGLCSDTSDVATLSLSPVSVTELMLFKNITIYPNPATRQVTINTDAKLIGSLFKVYNYIGKSIIEGKINSENTVVNLENLSQGIYVISIGDNIKQTFKVIKQ
jgi:hypothetical protein